MLLDADKSGSIDLDEFVSGCMQLHGPAKSLQLAKMSFENKFLGKKKSCCRVSLNFLGTDILLFRSPANHLVNNGIDYLARFLPSTI